MDSELEIIMDIKELLIKSSTDLKRYKESLTELNLIVIKSAQNAEYRAKLSSFKEIWDYISGCIESVSEENFLDEDLNFWYLRSLRGIVILARNISVENQNLPQELLLLDKVIKCFNKLGGGSSEIKNTLYTVVCEFLYNTTKHSFLFDIFEIDSLCHFLKYASRVTQNQENLLPYSLFFLNLVQNDDFLFYFLKHEDVDSILYQFIVEYVILECTEVPELLQKERKDLEKLSSIGIIQIKIFSKLLCNESFPSYLEQIENTDFTKFFTLLTILQLVVTSKDNWNKFELTGIMTWCFKLFEKTVVAIRKYFDISLRTEYDAEILLKQLVSILDIMSTLSKFEHVRKFIIFYKGLEQLIELFEILHINCPKVNVYKDSNGLIKEVKITNSLGEKIQQKEIVDAIVDYESHIIKAINFPECKSFIVEILGFLIYNNREIQDKMRELHGLELILSNCVIDDSNPFIKERSIMCIQFLLHENQENQEFISKLEAKKVVDDEILSNSGLEVLLDGNGKIKMASNNIH